MYPDVKWSILAVEWNWYCFNTFIFSRSIILLWVCQKRFISWWYIFSTFICKSKFFQILHIYISQPFQYAKKKLHLPKYWFPILINMKRSDRMVSFFSNFQLKLKFILSQKMTFSSFSYCGKIQHFGSFWPKDHILFHGLWCRENGQILNEWSNLAPKSLMVFCNLLSNYLALFVYLHLFKKRSPF